MKTYVVATRVLFYLVTLQSILRRDVTLLD